MITIYNRQRTYPVDENRLAQDVSRILEYLGYAEYDISLWITTDRTIRRYNANFRGKDKATDVLSFPATDMPIDQQDGLMHEDRVLGDIIISAAAVARQANELQVPFFHRLRRLVVHGICHLLGYDHQTWQEYQAMRVLEKRLMSVCHDALPTYE